MVFSVGTRASILPVPGVILAGLRRLQSIPGGGELVSIPPRPKGSGGDRRQHAVKSAPGRRRRSDSSPGLDIRPGGPADGTGSRSGGGRNGGSSQAGTSAPPSSGLAAQRASASAPGRPGSRDLGSRDLGNRDLANRGLGSRDRGNSENRGGRRRAAKPPQRVRQGLFFGGVRIAAIVVIELVAAAILLTPDLTRIWAAVVVALAVVVAAAGLIGLRGVRLGTWASSVISYSGRRHVTTVEPTNPTATETDGVEGAYPVPAEVIAFFPDLAVRQFALRSGEQVGLLRAEGTWSVSVTVTAEDSDVLTAADPLRLNVEKIVASLAKQELSLDAVQVWTQTLGGDRNRFGGGALSAIAAELEQRAPLLRDRTLVVTLQLNPISAREAIDARGGGMLGLQRLASAAIGTVRAEAFAAGLLGRPLDAAGVTRAMAVALLQPPVADESVLRWIESWKAIASAQVLHRSFVVSSWSLAALDDLTYTPSFGLTIAHEVRRQDTGGFLTVSTIRVSALSATELDAASDQLRSECRRIGVGVRLLRGQQASAFRMTIPGGQSR
ncbi:type VII secretion protein EccE [Jatrophihabitans sp. GAS493]|uniref:type VII secretion protein EccE n=1 Tax=Jatrophihabitans sp. GAS493 TaxID=1907575 RepID=UPI000BB70068|nr:type VII secretion protein EccE [Jatrophihabitans sp. GAS493]SOD72388.1 type VII secretion protein EccE [Jatrophihabitans sp. GAS493]